MSTLTPAHRLVLGDQFLAAGTWHPVTSISGPTVQQIINHLSRGGRVQRWRRGRWELSWTVAAEWESFVRSDVRSDRRLVSK